MAISLIIKTISLEPILMYENGGGTFLIPYILAIVIMAIPILVLEFGVGFKFKSSLPKVFYNIKSEFEIIAWFIVFLIFIVLIYYTCIMSWDLIYIVLSLFKGWGNNPSVFFTTTLLHSTSLNRLKVLNYLFGMQLFLLVY